MGQALGDWGWRDRYLPMHGQWLDVELGWEVCMNPNEVPNTLCSHQRSMNVEQRVMETPTHGVCALLRRDPAVPIPTDTST